MQKPSFRCAHNLPKILPLAGYLLIPTIGCKCCLRLCWRIHDRGRFGHLEPLDWLTSGTLDGLPKTLLDPFPTLAVHHAHIENTQDSGVDGTIPR